MSTPLQQFYKRIRDGIDGIDGISRLIFTAEKPISLNIGRATTWLDHIEAVSTATTLLEAAQAPITVIRWHKTDSGAGIPDDEETVFLCDDEGEIWLGYMQAGQWHSIDAMPLSWAPRAWARMGGNKP